jgi:hypothetical protein
MTFTTYHGKTIDGMARHDLIQCIHDVGSQLDRERRAWAKYCKEMGWPEPDFIPKARPMRRRAA